MSVLILKEIRELGWYALFWLLIMLPSYLFELMDQRIDETRFDEWCMAVCDAGISHEVVIFIIIIFFIAAFGLFNREFKDQTIDFLDALAVSRRTIFVSKVLALWLLIAFLLLATSVFDLLLLSMNQSSIDGRLYLQVSATILLRDCLFAYIVIAYTVFFSWFRTPGIFMFAALLIIAAFIAYQFPGHEWISLFSTYRNTYHGSTLLLDWPVILGHMALATVALYAGWRLWHRRLEEGSAMESDSVRRRWPGVVATLFTIVALIMTILYRVSVESGAILAEGIDESVSEHYQLVYAQEKSFVVEYLLEHIDSDYQALAGRLGAENLPTIRADLTSTSDHATGLASWSKIKINLDHGFEPDQFRRILSHETVHSFQGIESDGHLTDLVGGGFFIEGMAQYFSFEIVSEPATRESNRDIAAVAADRQDIGFRELIDGQAFTTTYDPELYYTLGETWVQAMVDICGELSLSALLRKLRDGRYTQILPAEPTWRNLLGAIGCDLDQVNHHWQKMQRQHLREMPERWPALEKVRFVVEDDDTVTATLQVEDLPAEPSEYRFYLKIMDARRADPSRALLVPGELTIADPEDSTRGSVTFHLGTHMLPGKEIMYQSGLRPDAGSRIYFEKWQRSRW